jgi:hypothetical protein
MLAGAVLFYPTIDLPPDSFGTRGNFQSDKLVHPETLARVAPQSVTILLAYFTRVGSELDCISEGGETTTLDFVPFA